MQTDSIYFNFIDDEEIYIKTKLKGNYLITEIEEYDDDDDWWTDAKSIQLDHKYRVRAYNEETCDEIFLETVYINEIKEKGNKYYIEVFFHEKYAENEYKGG